MSTDPIGVASARERGAPEVDAISAIERVGNDLQIVVTRTWISSSGTLDRLREKATVRLTGTDLDRLVDALTLARTQL